MLEEESIVSRTHYEHSKIASCVAERVVETDSEVIASCFHIDIAVEYLCHRARLNPSGAHALLFGIGEIYLEWHVEEVALHTEANLER